MSRQPSSALILAIGPLVGIAACCLQVGTSTGESSCAAAGGVCVEYPFGCNGPPALWDIDCGREGFICCGRGGNVFDAGPVAEECARIIKSVLRSMHDAQCVVEDFFRLSVSTANSRDFF